MPYIGALQLFPDEFTLRKVLRKGKIQIMKEKFDLLPLGRGGYEIYLEVLGTEILDLKR